MGTNSYRTVPKVKTLYGPTQILTATTTNAPSKDGRGARELTFTSIVSQIAGASPTVDVKIQHSRDGLAATFVDAPGLTFAQRTTVGSESRVPTADLMRFVRVVIVTAGTFTSATVNALMAYSNARGDLPNPTI